jgi:pimeloyl-ACP methyl ester carboxylesterase
MIDVVPNTRVPVDGGELAAFRTNAGGERGLAIVAHGFPDHPPSFAPVIAGLAARGLDVVAPWMRGYAPSTLAGPYDVDQLGLDLLAIARALAADRPVYLVGHDWGAIATYGALVHDADAAITAAVTLSVPHPIAFLRSLAKDGQWRRSWYMGLFQLPGAPALVRRGDFAFVDRLWRAWSPGYVLPAPARAALHACLAASWPAPLMHYRAIARPVGAARARIRRANVAITTPVLYLHGADDGCIAASAARGQERWLRALAAETVPGAGHFLANEVPDLVVDRVAAWSAAHRR